MRNTCKLLSVFIFSITGLVSNIQSQNSSDSINLCNTVSNFFNWYIGCIKNKKFSEIQPQFIENEKGMTTIDITRYIDNLKKMQFSDSLLNIEKNSYQKCIVNLQKVKFRDLKDRFDDLDDFEGSGCDFSNYYRWIGGQEPIDGIRIREVKIKQKKEASVTIDYFNLEKGGKLFYWGNNQVTLIKSKNHWEIQSINWR